jgi:hypothetical protein
MLYVRFLFVTLSVVVITAVLLFVLRNPRVSRLFARAIPNRPKRRLFLAAVSFFLTFAAVRSIAYANYHNLGPFHDIYISGRHIHHLVWGILLLLVVGYCWLVEAGSGDKASSRFAGRLIALLYGAGAALTLDEFALWLNLEDVYWTRQGRVSIDAVTLFGALLLIALWGRPFLRALGRELFRHTKALH